MENRKVRMVTQQACGVRRLEGIGPAMQYALPGESPRVKWQVR